MSQPSATLRKPLFGFLVFAVIAMFMTYLIWSTLQRTLDGPTGDYSTTFTDASGLAVGDDVRMAGVRVGRVESIKLEDGKARVGFDVLNSQNIYDNTQAAIRYQNLIGQRYLALTLDGDTPGKPLAKGSALKLGGVDSFDVTRLLGGFQPVFDTMTAEEVNGLTISLIDTFQEGDAISLSNTITQIGQVAEDMANRDEVLGAIITNLSVVMRELASQGDQVETLLTNTATLVEGLNSNSAAFGKSVELIGRTAQGFGTVIAQSQESLRSASSAARSATNRLIGIGSTLDRAAEVLPEFLVHFPMVMSQGAYLNIYACDLDISFGDVFLPPGLLHAIGGNQHSVVCR
ncbi:Mce family protein [Gordonia hirsuta DSM 44140 = NBRC 16056]|uniref:Mce family protein n=1 Tax=Gordonia hirsuta DSM 44140 = NBRC 16056 TaxID=1121927 RepID=L7L4M9_9ACTN|nr:MCE family protein [Gordonia hirsuta]GAC55904.1 Mce family protein [Gordonia hirsuta DSM 44140 = NBRC 16056]